MTDNFIDIASRWWISLGGAAASLTRIVVIILVAWLLVLVLQRAVKTLRERIAARMDDREAAKRAQTLGRVFRYLIAVVVSLVASLMGAGVMQVALYPAALLMAAMFFTSFYFTFRDSFSE